MLSMPIALEGDKFLRAARTSHSETEISLKAAEWLDRLELTAPDDDEHEHMELNTEWKNSLNSETLHPDYK